MKKIIVILMLTGSFYAQDDIILKSAGTDASKGIVFQNSDADTLMDINGDGLISISGSLTVKGPLTLGNLLFPNSDGTNGQVLTTNGSGTISWSTLIGVPSAYTLPSVYGTNGQVMTTNGSGVLSWATVSGSGGSGASSITGLSDALVEGNSIYLGNVPSASTDDALLNVAVGTTTLDEVTTGDMNTAVGASALSKNTTGYHNTGLGTGALNK